MQVSENIRNKIKYYPYGYVFTYRNVITNPIQKDAAIKALNRLVEKGVLEKLTKGKFYRPQNSKFGKIPLDSKQIVQDLLVKNGKTIAYLTGLNIYNKLGLTSQISNTIQIGTNNPRPSIKRDFYEITFKRQKNIISRNNVNLLPLLDAIKDIKNIPGSTIAVTSKKLLSIINNLDFQDIEYLIRLALNYPPYVRATLGSMLSNLSTDINLKTLQDSLNPVSSYKLCGLSEVVEDAKKWRITG